MGKFLYDEENWINFLFCVNCNISGDFKLECGALWRGNPYSYRIWDSKIWGKQNFQLLVLNLNLECKQEQMNDFTILNSTCCFTRSDSIFYQEGAWVSILSCKFVTCLLHWYFLIFLISYLFVNLNPFNILWQVFPETLDGKLFTTPAVVHFAL